MATPPSTTVLKAFELLGLFSERPLLGAGEAARLLGAPRASTHRLLVTLRAAGVLESNDHGQYRLGLRLFELGSCAPLRLRIHEESTLPLERLATEVALPGHVAVREGHDLLCLEKVHSSQTEIPMRIGQRAPLHTTAAGKVLLTHAPRSVVEHYVTAPLERPTRHTIVEPHRLVAEMDRIRQRGVAWDREESCLGMSALAAGIRNHTGRVVAAISLSAGTLPEGRRLHRAERSLLAAAQEIERRLGWCPQPAALPTYEPVPA